MIPGLGGLGGMNPKKLEQMMKQMGINQEEIDAVRVVVEKSDGSKIIVENPNVQKISMHGQESLQVSGEIRNEEESGFKEEDITLVMEKTGKSREEVKKVLEVEGDIAGAIIKLSE